MTHLRHGDEDLHHKDGSHRATARTANGTDVANHERRLRAHRAEHEARGTTTKRVTVELTETPYVCVDIEVDNATTDDEFEQKVEAALTERAESSETDSYIARLAVNEGYTVKDVE